MDLETGAQGGAATMLSDDLKAWWQISSLRAVVLLASAMIAVLAMSSAALLIDLRAKELAHAKGETVALTRVLSEQTTRAFDGVLLMMSGIQERMDDDYGRHLQLDSLPVRLLLKARSAGLPQVKSVFLVDHRGYGVNSSRGYFVKLLPMQQRTFFKYFSEGGDEAVFFSPPEVAKVDGEWTCYVSVALRDEGGNFRGVLVSALNLDYFESLYASIGLDAVSQILLLNERAELLAGQFREGDEIGKRLGDPGRLVDLAGRPEQSVLQVVPGANGRTRYVAFRPVAKYPLFVSASVDEEEALAPWREILRPMSIGVAVVILLVLVTAVILGRNLMRKESLELALIESGEQLRSMVESAWDAIVMLDSEGRVLMFNKAAEHLFNIDAGRVVGCRVLDALADRLSPEQLGVLGECLRSTRQGENRSELIELSVGGAQNRSVELSLSRSEYRGETRLTVVFRDSTERRRAEKALLESNRQLQELSTSLEAVREVERTRIARELHDELGQLLTGIRLEMSWLGGRLTPEQQPLLDRVAVIKGQIDQTVASVRRIASELRPLVLDDLGFNAAACWYIDQFSERTGLPVQMVLSEQDPSRGSPIATALFRILQESMTNIARHAEATNVEVRLGFEHGQWKLEVRDNGRGFVHDPGKCCDIGLIGMRERVQILGGRFSVQSSPGRGTLVTAMIPDGCEEDGDGKVTRVAGG